MFNKHYVVWKAWSVGLLIGKGLLRAIERNLDISHVCHCHFCMNLLSVCFISRNQCYVSALGGSIFGARYPLSAWPVAASCNMVAASLPLAFRLGVLSINDEGLRCLPCEFAAGNKIEYFLYCHVHHILQRSLFRSRKEWLQRDCAGLSKTKHNLWWKERQRRHHLTAATIPAAITLAAATLAPTPAIRTFLDPRMY